MIKIHELKKILRGDVLVQDSLGNCHPAVLLILLINSNLCFLADTSSMRCFPPSTQYPFLTVVFPGRSKICGSDVPESHHSVVII